MSRPCIQQVCSHDWKIWNPPGHHSRKPQGYRDEAPVSGPVQLINNTFTSTLEAPAVTRHRCSGAWKTTTQKDTYSLTTSITGHRSSSMLEPRAARWVDFYGLKRRRLREHLRRWDKTTWKTFTNPSSDSNRRKTPNNAWRRTIRMMNSDVETHWRTWLGKHPTGKWP